MTTKAPPGGHIHGHIQTAHIISCMLGASYLTGMDIMAFRPWAFFAQYWDQALVQDKNIWNQFWLKGLCNTCRSKVWGRPVLPTFFTYEITSRKRGSSKNVDSSHVCTGGGGSKSYETLSHKWKCRQFWTAPKTSRQKSTLNVTDPFTCIRYQYFFFIRTHFVVLIFMLKNMHNLNQGNVNIKVKTGRWKKMFILT